MATFGDMLAAADARLERVVQALSPLGAPDIKQQAQHPTTLAELARLAKVLGRCTDQVATGFGIPNAETTTVQSDARHASRLFGEAVQQLAPVEHPADEGPALARELKTMALSLGCGLDLLSSHLPTADNRNRAASTTDTATSNAGVISAADTIRWLLYTTGRHASAAGQVALRADTPSTTTAGRSLLQAALVARRTHSNDAAPITALTLNRLPERMPPSVGEDLPQAVHGIGISAERLRVADGPGAVTTWRYLAHSAALVYEAGTKLTAQLSRRLRELGDAQTAADLQESRASLYGLYRQWQTIARRWRGLGDTSAIPSAGLAVDASDLILRLGRLTFDDPEWAPTYRATQRLVPAERLMPGPAETYLVGTAILQAIDACATIASRHHDAVNDIAAIGVLRAPRPGTCPRLPAIARELLSRYTQAHHDGLAAVTQLGAALERSSSATPYSAQQTSLILKRAHASLRAHDVAQPTGAAGLAATDFPAPITTTIQATHKEPQQQAQAPEPASQTWPSQSTR
ncbi:hypothetical protein J4573_08560 [Actinomadura barringtoniae]|uniref:Uncharacterized protein n=1 Tax=Actinomadura barringtoniae TaxID=1427535 RepID=A0A939P7S7_9ACTN|nr:hypothetical protein [Actinomadura barringtoniae]MBO2447135.1 hypothetical protein [Actinomadura barringtoniae]